MTIARVDVNLHMTWAPGELSPSALYHFLSPRVPDAPRTGPNGNRILRSDRAQGSIAANHGIVEAPAHGS